MPITRYSTAKEIKEYLDTYIEGQEDAKRSAAVLVYNHLRGIKENICFVGPSGCGKTEIFRTLMRAFPKLIYIQSVSPFSSEGFRGGNKYNSCFCSMARLGWSLEEIEHSIVVFDEFDKIIEPTSSSEGNLAREYQREFLTMVEGSNIKINTASERRDDEGTTLMSTSEVSFVFCGAFESIFTERKKKATSVPLGFTSVQEDKRKKEVTLEELVKYGMRNELAGRISVVCTLYALTREQVRNLLLDPNRSPIAKLAVKYRANISVTEEFIDELLDTSQVEELGVRALYGIIQKEIDKEVYEEGSSGKVQLIGIDQRDLPERE